MGNFTVMDKFVVNGRIPRSIAERVHDEREGSQIHCLQRLLRQTYSDVNLITS